MARDPDYSPFAAPVSPIVRQPETILWTLTKAGRTATASIRQHPKGHELMFRLNDALLWSQAFTDGEGAILGTLADEKRRDFEARGWSA